MNQLFFENLLPGTLLFRRFILVRCLHATDFGGVYLCSDCQRDAAPTAIKILSMKARLQSRDPVRLLLRELVFSKCLEHPNVMQGQEFFRDDEFAAYSMEYAPFGSLADTLSPAHPLPVPIALEILKQVCAALAHVHDHRIVHGDIKPANILLPNPQQVRISDFGICAERYEGVIAPDTLAGSIDFLAPEYVAGGHISPLCDLYAVGVTAYELLSGTIPHASPDLMKTLTDRVRYDAAPLKRINPKISAALNEVVMVALQRDPSQRITSAKAMGEMFHEIQQCEFGWSSLCRNAFNSIGTILSQRRSSGRMTSPHLRVAEAC